MTNIAEPKSCLYQIDLNLDNCNRTVFATDEETLVEIRDLVEFAIKFPKSETFNVSPLMASTTIGYYIPMQFKSGRFWVHCLNRAALDELMRAMEFYKKEEEKS